MADNVGFLEELGVPSVDERAILAEQRRQERARSGYNADFSRGQQARPLLIGGLNALGGLLNNKAPDQGGRSLKGVMGNFSQGLITETDRQTAEAAGITPETLETRRRVRKDPAMTEIRDDGTFEARMKLAARVAEIARETGDTDTLSRSLSQMDSLRKQQLEFNKFKAIEERETEEFGRESVIDVFVDGKQTTGQQGLGPDGKTRGVYINDEFGNPTFKPAGTYFTQAPSGGAAGQAETLGKYWGRLTSPEDDRRIRGLIVQGRDHVRKSHRIIEALSTMATDSTISSASGSVVTMMDQAVRNIKGVASAFSSFRTGGAKDMDPDARRGWSGKSSWLAKAADPADPVWEFLDLPEEFKSLSADAQRYRAAIMEMAYISARMAEPSNRGLSDNDIQNALTRLAGNTANPQVMFRKLMELQADSAHTLEDEIDSWSGAMEQGGYSRQDFETFIGGKALTNYRTDLMKMSTDLGVSFDPVSGTASFERPLDADIHQPGEQPPPSALPAIIPNEPPAIDLRNMDDDEAAERMGL